MSASGFQNAPVTKGLLFATAGVSIFSQAARASRRTLPTGLDAAANVLVFRSPAELLFGAFLIYYFRVLERQAGPNKFGSFAFVALALQAVGQTALAKLAGWAPLSGPYGYIFACYVSFFATIPPSSKFSVLGWRLSDKAFIYLLGSQMLLSGGTATVVAGGLGIVVGVLYRSTGLRRFRLPRIVSGFVSTLLGPLLGDSSSAVAPTAVGSGHAAGGGRGGAPGTPGRRGGSAQAAAGQPGAAAGGGAMAVDPGALQQLMAMGFTEGQASRALALTHNDVAAAIALLV